MTARLASLGGIGVACAVLLAACTSSGSGTPSPPTSDSVGGSTDSSGTVSASSTDISFDVAGTTTYGTLEVPAHKNGQRLAAALLIPGSGPTDRNGNDTQLGVSADTLQIVAGLLAKQGIMSLRYDKYFAGKTGAGAYSDDPGSITIQSFFTQADAAYQFLAKQPQADPTKLLVVGHSEGGMIALNIAATTSTKPAGLALLEPQDQRELDLLQLQVDEGINALHAQGKLSVSEARSNAQKIADAIKQFRAGEQPDTDGISDDVLALVQAEILVPNNVKFSRTDDKIVPAQLAAKVKSGTRVLVTVGTRDTNVPPSTIDPLVQALNSAGTTGPGLQTLQNTDHDMHLPAQADTKPVLAPAVIAALHAWAQPFATG